MLSLILFSARDTVVSSSIVNGFSVIISSVAGFIAAPLISRGRKNYTLLSFLFGTVTMVAIFIMVPYLTNMLIFLPLLFANSPRAQSMTLISRKLDRFRVLV